MQKYRGISQMECWKKLDKKECMLIDPIYIKDKNKQN